MIRPHSSATRRGYLSRLVYSILVIASTSPFIRIQAQPGLLYSGVVSSAQGEEEIRWLEPAKPIERELTGGQPHSYQMTLAAGQYIKLLIDQRGIDLAVRLFGPDGKLIIEFDSEKWMQGQEIVELAVEAPGIYRLGVGTRQKNVAP